MAAVNVITQHSLDLRDGSTIRIHKVQLPTGTADTLTVPRLANTSANASSAQVRFAEEAALGSLADDGSSTLTMTGSTNVTYTLVTHHGPAMINYGDES